jgi:hypothetical protein
MDAIGFGAGRCIVHTSGDDQMKNGESSETQTDPFTPAYPFDRMA